MGKGSSTSGGGGRDNRRFATLTDEAEIQKSIGDKAWEDRLTDDQLKAIDMYMNREHAYKRINDPLRKEQEITDPRMAKAAKDLESALDDAWLNRGVVVTRRTGFEMFGDARTPSDIREKYGEVVTDLGFASGSPKADYTAFANTKPVELHIKVPGRQKGVGAYVAKFGESDNEYEFLFNRGSSFKILGSYYGNDGKKVHVNLEYVGRFKK